jgi:hypothetical protein
MYDIMQYVIYYVVDLFCLRISDVMTHTYNKYIFIYCHVIILS